MNRLVLFIAFVFILIPGKSQYSLQGTIIKKGTNEKLIGVNVFLPEYSRGTVSNKSGYYQITDLPGGKILLQFSHMGYKTKIVEVNIDKQNFKLDVILENSIILGEEIVVTGGFVAAQHNNVVKINTIQSLDLYKSGTPSFMESLKQIPGLDLISKGPGIGSPVIRGLSMSNILFLNNGVPMENFQFSENHPFMVDEVGSKKVEVIKGPVALMYGSGAIGGVLNLIKEAPAPEGKILGEAGVKYYSNTSGIVSYFGLRGTEHSFLWGVGGGMSSNMDYYDGNNSRVPNSRFNRMNLKTNMGLVKHFGSFRLFYDYNYDKLGLAVKPAIQHVSINSRENESWYQDLSNHLISSQNKMLISSTAIDLNLSFQSNNRKLYSADPLLVNMLLNTFNYKLKTALPAPEETKIELGIQGMEQSNKNGEAPQQVIPDARLSDFSVFALGQHYHWDVLMIQAGLRYDFRKIRVPGYVTGEHSHEEEPFTGDTISGIVRRFHNFNASLGTVWNLNDSIHFRFNLASAFRSPNIAELTQHGEHGTRFEMGDPDLNSQRNLEADLSFHYHSDHATLDLAGFYNQIFNYIHIAPTSDTTFDGDKIYKYSQTNAKLYGGEADLHIHPGPLHWMHIRATYAYTIGKKTNGGFLPFIPAQKIHLEIELQKNKIWQLRNLYFKISSDFAASQSKPAQFETPTPGYALIHAGVGAEIQIQKQRINFGIFVHNLTNRAYIDHLSTLKDLGYCNMGRNVSLTLKVPFGIRD